MFGAGVRLCLGGGVTQNHMQAAGHQRAAGGAPQIMQAAGQQRAAGGAPNITCRRLGSSGQPAAHPKSCRRLGTSGLAAPPSTLRSNAASTRSRARRLSVATLAGYLH